MNTDLPGKSITDTDGKKSAMELIMAESSNSSDEYTNDTTNRINSIFNNPNGQKFDTKYNYTDCDMEAVINNVDEYIIPECQSACYALWQKNIETFMVSNRDDTILYVLIRELSEKNKKIFDDMSKNDKRYFFDEGRHYDGIGVNGVDNSSSEELCRLTDVFEIQDVQETRYSTAEDFLEGYKRTDGEWIVLEDGSAGHEVNSALENATFEEALTATGKEGLYVPEEGKVYDSPMFLEWHKRYLQSIQSSDQSLPN